MKRGLLEALHELVERVSTGIREKAIVDAYLAGGSAVFVHLQRAGGAPADEARYSEDADIQFSRSLMLGDDIVVRFVGEKGEERLLTLDRTYSIDIGLRHPDCFEGAELLFESNNGRLRLHVLSPLDLAVTKAGRFQDHDRKDIALMARAGLIQAQTFRKRANEALDYLATDPVMVEINIEEAAEMIEKVVDL